MPLDHLPAVEAYPSPAACSRDRAGLRTRPQQSPPSSGGQDAILNSPRESARADLSGVPIFRAILSTRLKPKPAISRISHIGVTIEDGHHLAPEPLPRVVVTWWCVNPEPPRQIRHCGIEVAVWRSRSAARPGWTPAAPSPPPPPASGRVRIAASNPAPKWSAMSHALARADAFSRRGWLARKFASPSAFHFEVVCEALHRELPPVFRMIGPFALPAARHRSALAKTFPREVHQRAFRRPDPPAR